MVVAAAVVSCGGGAGSRARVARFVARQAVLLALPVVVVVLEVLRGGGVAPVKLQAPSTLVVVARRHRIATAVTRRATLYDTMCCVDQRKT